MTNTIVNTRKIFHWVDILVFNIFDKFQEASGMKKPSLYMSSYLVYTTCCAIHFSTF
jgi:hypothetical protein